MAWITKDDFIESYSKFKQRGAKFFVSKINLSDEERTKSTFDDVELQTANWWIIPAVKQRWNELITGSKTKNYETYFIEKYTKSNKRLSLLSIGSGISNHEIELARQGSFENLVCLDIAESLLNKAEQKAKSLGIHNMEFKVASFDENLYPEESFDIIMFHQSLHHFKNIDQLLSIVSKLLKPDGKLLLHEYVGPNRLIWNAAQLKASNALLQQIPRKWRMRFKTNQIKNSISGPGKLRMLISDPSEAVASESIIPALRKHFEIIEEKNIGGNLLCLILKDIAHHFVNEEEERQKLLESLFKAEDDFLERHDSDMIFGVYKPRA